VNEQGVGQGERERESLKQAPLPARSPRNGWDHDLS